ncbi:MULTISPECIES: methionine ABC transporter permease [Shouchella]|uniref:Binding-protein-dependent transport systems inner membrane component domain-containing protein n=3 Tax=Bacillaceae TaxID=186817 RepID=A0A060LNK9_9BACI|nr:MULTISPECIES: methionine ABC transporter permease [Bacillaceae]RQW22554.1 ABC transporter permease [Bacillus sp. C1-1]AIC92951.1 binding-protein-dependent transport systems inner membrane component domain-containing protein [Shouchella lehensis G1]KQL56228.1 methionine ABC transporter permease [Alkalicoccobacillus plakortidis]MBG9783248.1 methionine ABC transporter permease [Shouchella lehensis]TES49378.1 ABC transporter permease [Shouchella lehensis]
MLDWLPEAIRPEITSDILTQALFETIYMVAWSLLFSALLGVVLGVILVVTRPGHIMENRLIYNLINPVINVLRSIPFIILLVAIIPITRFFVGTAYGTTAAIVPLVFYAGPYIARLIENSLLEIEPGIIEAADSMGASKWQIIFKFLVPEAMGSLILSMTTATIGLLGATAMAGAIGAGGIGEVAISYGYNRFDDGTMFITVLLLIIMVQGLQTIGNIASKKVRRR